MSVNNENTTHHGNYIDVNRSGRKETGFRFKALHMQCFCLSRKYAGQAIEDLLTNRVTKDTQQASSGQGSPGRRRREVALRVSLNEERKRNAWEVTSSGDAVCRDVARWKRKGHH